MTAHRKLLERILRATSDQTIEFRALRNLLKKLGFKERVKGNHHIFWKDDIAEILNLQPRGTHAKAYQVKQVRMVVVRYKLESQLETEE